MYMLDEWVNCLIAIPNNPLVYNIFENKILITLTIFWNKYVQQCIVNISGHIYNKQAVFLFVYIWFFQRTVFLNVLYKYLWPIKTVCWPDFSKPKLCNSCKIIKTMNFERVFLAQSDQYFLHDLVKTFIGQNIYWVPTKFTTEKYQKNPFL